MLTVRKGDPAGLQGKALIYACNRGGVVDDPVRPPYPGIFVGATYTDLMEVMHSADRHVSPDAEPHLRALCLETQEHWKLLSATKRLAADLIRTSDFSDLLPGGAERVAKIVEWTCAREETAAEADIATARGISYPALNYIIIPEEAGPLDGDIVQAPDVPEERFSNHLLNQASSFYLSTFFVQQQGKIPSPEGYASAVKNFRDLPPEEFRQKLFRLGGDLLGAMELGQDVRSIAGDLKALTAGAPFIRDVNELYETAMGNAPNRRELTTRYLEKIAAIVTEDFEAAGRLGREISQLRREWPHP
ncbi:MAG: hypothetical protein HY520_01840 [Candidatus Aenigmarchaeota archaeon]|nr:hypothetical protein [Candidatus Aenigmarchaeota archaeon]